MSFLIPELKEEYIYVVKNPQTVDINAAIKEWSGGSLSGVDYKILEYQNAHTFDAATDYAEYLTMEEMQISILSGAFWDLVGELNNPATHMAAHEKYRPFEENDTVFCYWLIDDLKAHLRYVIGANDLQLSGMYNGVLQTVCVCLAMGDVGAAYSDLMQNTATDLQTATGLGTVAQWQQLIDHITLMATPFLNKFPR